MLIIPHQLPTAIVAQSIPSKTLSQIQKIGVCHVVPNRSGHDPESSENAIDPKLEALLYLGAHELPKLDLNDVSNPVIDVGPAHGKLTPSSASGYSYLPAEGYYGPDRAVINIKVNGHSIKVIYYFQSIDSIAIGNTTYADLCSKGDSWKI